MSDPDASIIIPSFNQKHTIFDALDSIFRQKTSFRYEVLVVESTGDDTAELIRQKYPQVRVLEKKERAFPGTARNVAIEQAKGRILAFTDTDCIVREDWLHTLIETHEQGHSVVGGMVKNGTPSSIVGTLDYCLEFSDLITPHPTTEKTHFGTCNVSFDADIFKNHGLFADQVKGSDSIYTRKLVKDGEQLYHQPKAIIWHRNRTSLKKVFKNQYELGYGAAINRHKYDLKGKVFVQYPVLIPLLPFVKWAAISLRLLKSNFGYFVKFLLLSPLALAVLTRYAIGFYRGRKAILGERKKKL